MNETPWRLRDPNEQLNADGLVLECINSIANALELLQSCTKPSMRKWTKT